jgi:hypothetical protein
MASAVSFPISNVQKAELVTFARIADREARSDLSLGFIRDEDDYTSNFTGALRRIINSNSRSGLRATSVLLATSVERRLGCDGCIIISAGGHAKIAAFEAKWPRFSQSHHRWDYSQTSTGLSHFSDQLDRQRRHSGLLAIFEMFYCEYPFKAQPAYLHDEFSSCVWHDVAKAFDHKRRSSPAPWTQAELQALLTGGSLDVGQVLEAVCNCSAGQPIFMPAGPELIAREFGLSGHVLFVEADWPEKP